MAPAGPQKPAVRGERFDDASGLQYLNARYYDPKLAMFIQPDWWEVMQQGVGTNRYSYSFNDPVNAKDPSGHCYEFGDMGGGGSGDCPRVGTYPFAPRAWVSNQLHDYADTVDAQQGTYVMPEGDALNVTLSDEECIVRPGDTYRGFADAFVPTTNNDIALVAITAPLATAGAAKNMKSFSGSLASRSVTDIALGV